MVYTVHGGSKTGDFTLNTHQETGPKSRGFLITVSVLPPARSLSAPRHALKSPGNGADTETICPVNGCLNLTPDA
jgi:hypothetical protein